MHPVATAYWDLMMFGWKPDNPEVRHISDNAKVLLEELGANLTQIQDCARAHLFAYAEHMGVA